MDITLRVVVTAAILMVIFGVVLFIFTDEAGNLGDIANDQKERSSCQLWKTSYQNQYCPGVEVSGDDSDNAPECNNCELQVKLEENCADQYDVGNLCE